MSYEGTEPFGSYLDPFGTGGWIDGCVWERGGGEGCVETRSCCTLTSGLDEVGKIHGFI